MIGWSHREAGYLKLAMQGEPVQILGRGDPELPEEINALGRTPRGHPEGLREAFVNIYAEVAQERMARELGEPVPKFPTRASRRARTRWRSLKRAWPLTSGADGLTWNAKRDGRARPRRRCRHRQTIR
jgi:hypothetical protein